MKREYNAGSYISDRYSTINAGGYTDSEIRKASREEEKKRGKGFGDGPKKVWDSLLNRNPASIALSMFFNEFPIYKNREVLMNNLITWSPEEKQKEVREALEIIKNSMKENDNER